MYYKYSQAQPGESARPRHGRVPLPAGLPPARAAAFRWRPGGGFRPERQYWCPSPFCRPWQSRSPSVACSASLCYPSRWAWMRIIGYSDWLSGTRASLHLWANELYCSRVVRASCSVAAREPRRSEQAIGFARSAEWTGTTCPLCGSMLLGALRLRCQSRVTAWATERTTASHGCRRGFGDTDSHRCGRLTVAPVSAIIVVRARLQPGGAT